MAAQTNGGRRGNRWVTAAWVTITALLLLTPLVAMQFSDEVNWTLSDFAFAGAVLVGAGIIYEFAARAGNLAYQAAVVVALGTSVLTLWTTGAVGIIGSEANPANLLYVAVVGLVIVGALVGRGRARHMVWVAGAAAIATVLVPVIGYLGVSDPQSDVFAPEVFAATGALTIGWALSAVLFRRSLA